MAAALLRFVAPVTTYGPVSVMPGLTPKSPVMTVGPTVVVLLPANSP